MEQEPIKLEEDVPSDEEDGEKAPSKDKTQSRINALIFGLVFLMIAVAPYPWNTYAPLLFLLPLIYSVLKKLKQKAGAEEVPESRLPGSRERHTGSEPFAGKPKDPKDPRKYRPIG